ncbi:MAG: TetR/AcrR family transcriptional regulator [Myxococcaceae bacterium]
MARRNTAEARKAPRQERAKATVDAILRAAAHILREEGYEACSTNRVALKAGVSIGSLYQYYPSKEALVMALAERHSEQAYGLLLRTASEVNGAPLKVAVRKFIEAMGELHKMDPKLHRVLTEHTTKIGGFEAVKRLTMASATFVRGYLESLGPQIRKMDLDTATFVVVTTVEALTHIAAMETEHGPTDPKLVDELTHLVLRYLEPA